MKETSMSIAKHATKPSILETVDKFITAVPWGGGRWRCVLVHRREHGGRTYIRLNTWNRHRTKFVWYPSKRFFVIPIENAKALADALCRATAGWSDDKPDDQHLDQPQAGRLSTYGCAWQTPAVAGLFLMLSVSLRRRYGQFKGPSPGYGLPWKPAMALMMSPMAMV